MKTRVWLAERRPFPGLLKIVEAANDDVEAHKQQDNGVGADVRRSIRGAAHGPPQLAEYPRALAARVFNWTLPSRKLATSYREIFMPIAPFSDLNVTHDHEEKLRSESLTLIHADPELSRRLAVIEKAMALIFAYTLDHKSRSDNEATMQMLGISGKRLYAIRSSCHRPTRAAGSGGRGGIICGLIQMLV
jgi:hypothetical protein